MDLAIIQHHFPSSSRLIDKNIPSFSILGSVNLRPRWLPTFGLMTSPNGQFAVEKWTWRRWNKAGMGMQQNTWFVK